MAQATAPLLASAFASFAATQYFGRSWSKRTLTDRCPAYCPSTLPSAKASAGVDKGILAARASTAATQNSPVGLFCLSHRFG